MRIYADTSWLISFLYPGDPQHAAARGLMRKHAADEWLTSDWSRLETYNALRQLSLAPDGPQPDVAEALRRLFKSWHKRGPFEEWRDANWKEAVDECQQASAARGTTLRMHSADVLHVALLEQMECDLFVTRDKDQYALAVSRGLAAHLAP